MRFFKEFNTLGEPCPLCNRLTQAETMLSPMLGTEDGRIVEAKQVHRECVEALLVQYAAACAEETNERINRGRE